MRSKTDIVDDLHARTGISKADINTVLGGLKDSIYEHLKASGEYVLPGLGTLTVSRREARKGRNPQTGEAIDIAASNSVRLKVSKPLRDSVN